MSTLKQKKAIERIIENHGNVSRAMLEVGYDPNTAKNPKNLTASRTWKELMNDYLPDEKLLKKHDEALEAKKWNDFTGEREPDQTTRLRAVELGYKLKGKLKDAIINVEGNMNMGLLIEGYEDKTT